MSLVAIVIPYLAYQPADHPVGRCDKCDDTLSPVKATVNSNGETIRNRHWRHPIDSTCKRNIEAREAAELITRNWYAPVDEVNPTLHDPTCRTDGEPGWWDRRERIMEAATSVLAARAGRRCTCGTVLDPWLAANGYSTHINCGAEAEGVA